MTPRGFLVLAVLLAAAAGAMWLWPGRGEQPAGEPSTPAPLAAASADRAFEPAGARVSSSAPATPVRIASAVQPGMPMAAPATPAAQAVASVHYPPADPPLPHARERSELEAVQFMLRDYRTRMGENPVGSNAEIMRALTGDNPAHARLGPPEGQSLNAEGELVDRWGKPYFFHQLSKDRMEIRSAGPDGQMWTPDDLVAK